MRGVQSSWVAQGRGRVSLVAVSVGDVQSSSAARNEVQSSDAWYLILRVSGVESKLGLGGLSDPC